MTRLRTVEPVIVSLGTMALLVLGTGAGAVLAALLFRA